jgi:hypothetical protein
LAIGRLFGAGLFFVFISSGSPFGVLPEVIPDCLIDFDWVEDYAAFAHAIPGHRPSLHEFPQMAG